MPFAPLCKPECLGLCPRCGGDRNLGECTGPDEEDPRWSEPALWEAALTHRSFAFEQGVEPTNERLEFLGDAVLGLVITDLAYRGFPDLSEGELAKLRAATVNMSILAGVARELGLGEDVLL